MLPRLFKNILILIKQNLIFLLIGKTFTVPSLGSMTLDRDDVDIAKQWLKKREEWRNSNLVGQYEKEFARWNGSRHAFAFKSGRAALSACIATLGLVPGDEVIIPGYTCVVVLNALDYAGVKAVFSDIELETYGLDVTQLEGKISGNTRAILLHHLYGLVCRDYEAILQFARQHGLRVIEDCAHATGAVFKGKKVGNRGDLSFYSTEQSKVFNTIQGGIATTNDEFLAERLGSYYAAATAPDWNQVEKQLYNVILNYYQYKHPWRWFTGIAAECFWGSKRLISTPTGEEAGMRPAGYDARMSAPIAALGLNQLKKVDRYNEQRRVKARKWDSWCDRYGYVKPLVIPESQPVYLRYPVLVEQGKKRSTRWALQSEKVMLGVWFVTNTHPVQRNVAGCRNADVAVARCVNFPCLTD